MSKLFVISGHSGSGKTTVMREIIDNELKSFTTRKKRVGEVEGFDYFFITEEEYFDLKDKGGLAESTTYDGNHYGITLSEIENKLKLGNACAVVDFNGKTQLSDKLGDDVVSIMIYTEYDVAYRNMKARGDSEENIQKRLLTYEKELLNKSSYDYVIKNVEGKFDNTINIFKNIIESESGFESSDKKESFIGTYSGGKFFPFDPREEDVCIEDIVHSLSSLARYNGHTKHFYSVAQHSINCAKILKKMGCSDRIILLGLLHDASEAYISDIPSPIKKYIDNIETIEDNIFKSILNKLKISYPSKEEWDIVMEVDRSMLYFEGKNITENADNWCFNYSKYVNLSLDYSMLDLNEKTIKEIKKEFMFQYLNLYVKTILK